MNDDIPEDDDIPVYRPTAKPASKIEIPTNSEPTQKDVSDDEVNDLIGDDLTKDPDEEGLDVPNENSNSSSLNNDDKNAEDILAELGI